MLLPGGRLWASQHQRWCRSLAQIQGVSPSRACLEVQDEGQSGGKSSAAASGTRSQFLLALLLPSGSKFAYFIF